MHINGFRISERSLFMLRNERNFILIQYVGHSNQLGIDGRSRRASGALAAGVKQTALLHRNASDRGIRIPQVFSRSLETHFYTETVEENFCRKVRVEDGKEKKEQRG